MELLNKGSQYILLSAPFSLRQEKIKKSEVDRAKRGMLLVRKGKKMGVEKNKEIRSCD